MVDILADMNLRDLWENAAVTYHNKTFFIFQGRNGATLEYSYREFNDEINRTANLMLELGVEKEERVAVQLENSPEFLMCLFGLAKIGAIIVPIHRKASLAESRHFINTCGARLAVIEETMCAGYRELLDDPQLSLCRTLLTRCKENIVGTDASASADARTGESMNHLCFDLLKDAQPAQLTVTRPLDGSDIAEIIFTSGTTSQPKGVMLTHANFIFSGVYSIWQTSMRDDDRLLTTMPACHSNFQLAALPPVLVAGATLILLEHYSARCFWSEIRKYRATLTQCVSMMVRTLLMQEVNHNEQDHCLRDVLYFLPLSDVEKHTFESRFRTRLLNSYGSTESVGWVITDPPYGQRRWPSVGRVGLGYEARITGDDGRELLPYETGEIQIKGVRGRSIMAGYYDDEEETAAVFDEEGWMRTGDKGYCDEDGWFYFVDRKVNLIKRAGENISASEIETVLSTYPGVAEVAVIGVSDPIRDEAVKAFIVPQKGVPITPEDILEYSRKNLAEYKVPSYVEIKSSLPHTCSMKIEKKLLF